MGLQIQYKIFNKEGHWLGEGKTEYKNDWDLQMLKNHLIQLAKHQYPQAEIGYITTEYCLYWKPFLIKCD